MCRCVCVCDGIIMRSSDVAGYKAHLYGVESTDQSHGMRSWSASVMCWHWTTALHCTHSMLARTRWILNVVINYTRYQRDFQRAWRTASPVSLHHSRPALTIIATCNFNPSSFFISYTQTFKTKIIIIRLPNDSRKVLYFTHVLFAIQTLITHTTDHISFPWRIYQWLSPASGTKNWLTHFAYPSPNFHRESKSAKFGLGFPP